MFLGQYSHTIDEKGRLTIPARFRDELSDGAYITQGWDRNLVVYTTESFQVLARRAMSLTTTDPEARAIRRVLFGRANEVTVDSSGRILIPPFLREYSQLEGESILVGAGEYFEIWNALAWNKELASVIDSESNARRFSSFDLSAG